MTWWLACLGPKVWHSDLRFWKLALRSTVELWKNMTYVFGKAPSPVVDFLIVHWWYIFYEVFTISSSWLQATGNIAHTLEEYLQYGPGCTSWDELTRWLVIRPGAPGKVVSYRLFASVILLKRFPRNTVFTFSFSRVVKVACGTKTGSLRASNPDRRTSEWCGQVKVYRPSTVYRLLYNISNASEASKLCQRCRVRNRKRLFEVKIHNKIDGIPKTF